MRQKKSAVEVVSDLFRLNYFDISCQRRQNYRKKFENRPLMKLTQWLTCIFLGVFLTGCAEGPDGSAIRQSLTSQPISDARWQQLVGTYSGVINTTATVGLNKYRVCTALTVTLSGTGQAPRVLYTDHWASADLSDQTYGENNTCSNAPESAEQFLAKITTHAPDTIVLSCTKSAAFVLRARHDGVGFDLEMDALTGGRFHGTGVLLPGLENLAQFQPPEAGNVFISGVNPISQGLQGFQAGAAAGAAAKASAGANRGNAGQAAATNAANLLRPLAGTGASTAPATGGYRLWYFIPNSGWDTPFYNGASKQQCVQAENQTIAQNFTNTPTQYVILPVNQAPPGYRGAKLPGI